MKLNIRARCCALFAVALAAWRYRRPPRAQSFAPDQRGEIEKIMREYLLSHPELLQDAMAELEKRQTAEDAEKHRAAVKDNAPRSSPRRARSISAIRRATSPWSSSSTTIAASASAPWPTCSIC